MEMQQLINELKRLTFHYHEMASVESDKVLFKAVSMDPRGIDEVMKIKEIVDRHRLHTVWDGQNIEILTAAPTELR
jgi:hypothetical protein